MRDPAFGTLLAELASGQTPEPGLGRAALLMASDLCGPIDVAAQSARLDDLALRARPAVERTLGRRDRIPALNRFLFEQEGFRGNDADYEDPRNSFLHEVLDRRVGIPITLSILYMEIAQRLGYEAHGIGFPGHFLAAVRDPGARGAEAALAEVVVDPFGGRVLNADGCQALLRRALGPHALLAPHHLKPASVPEILVRMLSNLKAHFAKRSDFHSALTCCERLLTLLPDDPDHLRDRGLVFEQLECFDAAREDLERFLELATGHPTADSVRERLEALPDRSPKMLH